MRRDDFILEGEIDILRPLLEVAMCERAWSWSFRRSPSLSYFRNFSE
jgi:hypothetical protein